MSSTASTFASIEPGLHPLLLRSLGDLGFPTPTPIQATLLPIALSSSRDILARARTGSGKTLAYAVPIVQSLFEKRNEDKGTRALVLVPTRELAEQVRGQIGRLVTGLGQAEGEAFSVVNIAGGSDGRKKRKLKSGGERMERMQLADKPDIVVSTPSQALVQLRTEGLHLDQLTHLVIDEADLILSYGHSTSDIRAILSGPWGLPKVYQSLLMSATLTGEVEELKGIVLRDPVTLKLEEDANELANLSQFYVKCTEEEKFLLLYVILKLRLVKGKCLIFVNDTNRGYRVKLFLEKFGIKTGVLNSELPFNSRYHAVQEFNRGVFDYLIATDESGLEGNDRDINDQPEAEVTSDLLPTQSASAEAPEASTSTAPPPESKKRKRKEASAVSNVTEYGVSRGVDFIDVACVLNFDLPFSSRSYTHRVGRTARAGRTGTALSFIVPKAEWGKKKQNDISLETAKKDESVWKRIEASQIAKGGETKEYKFDMKQVEGFRYRMDDALRSVTKLAVKEARIAEIKREVVNSDKLKAHFEDNPRDLDFLRHDKPLHPSRVQPHLKHVPNYLIPRIAAVASSSGPDGEQSSASTSAGATDGSRVPFHKHSRSKNGKGRGGKMGLAGRAKAKRVDPLKKGGKVSLGGKGKKA